MGQNSRPTTHNGNRGIKLLSNNPYSNTRKSLTTGDCRRSINHIQSLRTSEKCPNIGKHMTLVTGAENISNLRLVWPKRISGRNRPPGSGSILRHDIFIWSEEICQFPIINKPLFISGIINKKEMTRVMVDIGNILIKTRYGESRISKNFGDRWQHSFNALLGRPEILRMLHHRHITNAYPYEEGNAPYRLIRPASSSWSLLWGL